MKRMLIFILAFMLVLLVSFGAMAAAHRNGDDYAVTDTWYYVEDTKPYLYVSNYSYSEADTGFTVVEFYENDQTFACLRAGQQIGYTATVIKGSYLFKPGIFVGLQNYSGDYYNGGNIISPGYRLSFGENSYVAFSLDYDMPKSGNSQIFNLDIDAKFLQENMKIIGYLNIPQGDYSGNDSELGVNFYYRIIDPLTVYAGLHNEGESEVTVGGTFKGVPHLILDGALQTGSGSSALWVSGMFLIGNFGVGGEIYTLEGESQITLKAKYATDKNRFVLMYAPKTDYWSSKVSLAYELNFGESNSPRNARGN